ncbi:MAG TPA: recombinase family protein [Gammaproteobacteria bacterium]|jgi:DNA invertase Pin-like site-specific DNA recombinase|nr:recombinase family protein [Gammaproteobacteria bacterium]
MSNQHVGYIRISTASQNDVRQLDGISLDKEFRDVSSGAAHSRPVLDSCIEYVREGDTLYIDSIDRLARNLRDLQTILNKLVTKGVTVRFVKENLNFTYQDDAMANLMLHMMGAFAEFERNMIRSRQKEGIALAKKVGKHLGRPFKLTNVHKEEAMKLKDAGQSIRRISINMKISRTSVYKLLELDKKSRISKEK